CFGDILWSHRCDLHREVSRRSEELLIPRDEVGLRVQFNDGDYLIAGMLIDPDDPLGGHLTGALTHILQSLLAEGFNRLVHVATDLSQRALTIHHTCARLLTKLLDELWGYL